MYGKTKKWLKWSVPLGLSLVLAACGGNSENKGKDASPSVSPSPSISESASPSLSPSSSASSSTATAEGFETFEDETNGFEFQYPQDWTQRTNVEGTVIFLLAPVESGATFHPNFNVVVQDFGGQSMDLAQYTELNKQQLEQLITDFKLESEERVSGSNGVEFQELLYTGKQGQLDLIWLQLYTIQNGKAYICTYTSNDDSYNKNIDAIQKMAESMVFSK